jgi:uncharacterized membrane protein YgcG
VPCDTEKVFEDRDTIQLEVAVKNRNAVWPVAMAGWTPDDMTFRMCLGTKVKGGMLAMNTKSKAELIVFMECETDGPVRVEVWNYCTMVNADVEDVTQRGHGQPRNERQQFPESAAYVPGSRPSAGGSSSSSGAAPAPRAAGGGYSASSGGAGWGSSWASSDWGGSWGSSDWKPGWS